MDARIQLLQGDITKLHVDAVVNAANSSLLGGGGVDGAIHRAGGKAILEECVAIRNKQGGCGVGDSVITTAGEMPAKYVIHAVGPVWSKSNTGAHDLLSNAYRNSLVLAVNNNVKTIAFPNISTGIYGFPKQEAAAIAVKTVEDFLISDRNIEGMIFICFDLENYEIYEKLLSE